MKINLSLTISFVFFFASSTYAQVETYTSVANGNWNDPTTWDVGGSIPGASDIVIIEDSVYLNLSSKITVSSLTLTNNSNSKAKLVVDGTDTLEVLSDITGTAANKSYDVDLQVKGSATLYVFGNVNFERVSQNIKTNMLRFYIYENARATIIGNFNFDYKKSHDSEGDYEIYLAGDAILDITGETKLTCDAGKRFDFYLTDNAQAILRDSLTMLLTTGKALGITSDNNSHFQLLNSVYISNTDGPQNAFLKAGNTGGKITIQENITLEATTAGRLSMVESNGESSEVNILGDISMNSTVDGVVGIKLKNSGDLYFGGNLIRPTDKGFFEMSENSLFVLNGTESQSIPETKLAGSGQDSLCIRSMSLQNTSGEPMMLSGDLTIEDTLFLSTGKIQTTGAGKVVLNDKAIISGGDENNYIIGSVLKKGTADSLFLPIGTDTKYAPIQVSEITDPSASMTITYFTDPPPFGTGYSLSGLDNISLIQHWKVERTSSVDDLDYTLHWMDDAANGISDTSGIVVAGLEGFVYQSYGREMITSVGSTGSVTSAFTDPPPFGTEYLTIGSTKASNSLPVEMKRFQAGLQDEEVHIKWETATEIKTSHFEVQHAQDGTEFKPIDIVEAVGNSFTIQNYSTIHNSPNNGDNYYRLKIVDIDGSFEYSAIRVVNFEKDETFNIFPNSVDKEIIIDGAESFGEKSTLKIFDKMGRQIFIGEVDIKNGKLQISTNKINVTSVGTYFLQITGARDSKVLKFIKVE